MPDFKALLRQAIKVTRTHLGEPATLTLADGTVIGTPEEPIRVVVHRRRDDGDGRAEHFINQPQISVTVFAEDYPLVVKRGGFVTLLDEDDAVLYLEAPLRPGDERKVEYGATDNGGG